jgi:LysM repeat protein
MIRIFLILLLIPSFLFSNDTEAYIKKYRKTAIKEMRKYGIPASITLAQGILESGSGKSRLARKGRNHFGIKCTSDWNGRTIKEDDDKKDECFRRYRKAKHSYRDHSEFLANKKRYAFLFEYDKRDYKAWANGLKQAGYATNPNYPTLLITLIEKYDLHKYDKRGAKRAIRKEEREEEETSENTQNNTTNNYKYHEVKKGDTMYSISKKYNISIEKLKSLNNKKSNELFLGEKIRVE